MSNRKLSGLYIASVSASMLVGVLFGWIVVAEKITATPDAAEKIAVGDVVAIGGDEEILAYIEGLAAEFEKFADEGAVIEVLRPSLPEVPDDDFNVNITDHTNTLDFFANDAPDALINGIILRHTDDPYVFELGDGALVSLKEGDYWFKLPDGTEITYPVQGWQVIEHDPHDNSIVYIIDEEPTGEITWDGVSDRLSDSSIIFDGRTVPANRVNILDFQAHINGDRSYSVEELAGLLVEVEEEGEKGDNDD